jgi:hypothetical protein
MTKTKWEVTFQDDETITVWRFNSEKTSKGPYEVEVKYKKGYVHPSEVKKKTLGDLVKEQKTKPRSLKK